MKLIMQGYEYYSLYLSCNKWDLGSLFRNNIAKLREYFIGLIRCSENMGKAMSIQFMCHVLQV